MPIRHTAPALLSGLVASVLLTGIALGADAPASQREPSKEMRQKMATLHEQMAACLRSDKAVADCRTEMMKGCQEQMGSKGCGMMGGAMNGMDGHKNMMSGPSSSAPTQ
jgi:hypothetical protein